MEKLAIWLTPLWILAVGVTVGAALLLIIWGIIWLFNRGAARAVSGAVGEGVLRPISYVIIALASLGVLAAPAMPVKRVLESLQRLSAVQPIERRVEVPAHKTDFPVAAAFRAG